MQKLANGSTIGSYTILRLIGRGGMGEVYEAHEGSLGRRVALKIIAPQNAGANDEVDLLPRFLNEARTLAQVNHPNVVTIHAIQKIPNHHFIAMEYVEGASFRDLFSLFSFSAHEMAPYFLQLLEGVGALHNRMILHRDLKPQNLMLRPDGQVKILDFGIAKREGEGDAVPETLMGTLSYMAPEVVGGSRADFRADLWSLGAIFYEALVGNQLITLYSERIKGIRAQPDSNVVFPEECLERVPPSIRRFIGRLCEGEPEHRFANAEEAARELKRIILELPDQPLRLARSLNSTLADIDEGVKANARKLGKRDFLCETVYTSDQPLIYTNTTPLEKVKTESITGRQKARRKMRRTQRRANYWPAVAFGIFALGFFSWAVDVGLMKHLNKFKSQVVTTVAPPPPQPVRVAAPAPPPPKSQPEPQFEDTGVNVVVDMEVEAPTVNVPQPRKVASLSPRTGLLHRPRLVQPMQEFGVKFTGSMPSNWPVFSWRAVEGARGYKIVLSKQPDFKNVLKVADVKSTSFEWRKFVAGKIYWRVTAEGESENPYSETGVLTVTLPPPTLSSSYTYSDMGLEWEAVPLAQKYIVQWSRDRQMSSPVEKATAKPQVSLPMSAGLLYVRVAAANDKGQRVSAFSRVTRVTGLDNNRR